MTDRACLAVFVSPRTTAAVNQILIGHQLKAFLNRTDKAVALLTDVFCLSGGVMTSDRI